MAGLTLGQIGEALAVEHCRGTLPSGHCPQAHADGGSATLGVVHMYGPGYLTNVHRLRFLYLAAIALNPDLEFDEPWRRVYRIAMFQRAWALTLRIRMPRGHQSHMKAFVLAGVAGLSNSVPLRKQAYDWARR